MWGVRGKKKSFCWNTNIFCETDWSNYSSGTVIVRGCGNKYQPRFSLTINILFFSKLAQAWSLLKPLLSPYQRTVIGATSTLWQGHNKLLPKFHVTAPGIPLCTSKGGQWQHDPGEGGAEYSSYPSNIPCSLDNCIAWLVRSSLYTHAQRSRIFCSIVIWLSKV